MKDRIGFIGSGNMAYAMVGGIVNSGNIEKTRVSVWGKNIQKNDRMKEDFNITIEDSAIGVVENCKYIILAVKPHLYEEVIKGIENHVTKDSVIISIAAGVETKTLRGYFKEERMIVRTMPNTPAMVCEGMSAICEDTKIPREIFSTVEEIFSCFGEVEIIKEEQMHAFIGISGSSPAYAYMFIEALADAGVKQGMKREKAYKMAAQALIGAGKMVLESGEHPGRLKDNVCSPGGTTIEAVAMLEKKGFRDAVISAVDICSKKSREMGK